MRMKHYNTKKNKKKFEKTNELLKKIKEKNESITKKITYYQTQKDLDDASGENITITQKALNKKKFLYKNSFITNAKDKNEFIIKAKDNKKCTIFDNNKNKIGSFYCSNCTSKKILKEVDNKYYDGLLTSYENQNAKDSTEIENIEKEIDALNNELTEEKKINKNTFLLSPNKEELTELEQNIANQVKNSIKTENTNTLTNNYKKALNTLGILLFISLLSKEEVPPQLAKGDYPSDIILGLPFPPLYYLYIFNEAYQMPPKNSWGWLDIAHNFDPFKEESLANVILIWKNKLNLFEKEFQEGKDGIKSYLNLINDDDEQYKSLKNEYRWYSPLVQEAAENIEDHLALQNKGKEALQEISDGFWLVLLNGNIQKKQYVIKAFKDFQNNIPDTLNSNREKYFNDIKDNREKLNTTTKQILRTDNAILNAFLIYSVVTWLDPYDFSHNLFNKQLTLKDILDHLSFEFKDTNMPNIPFYKNFFILFKAIIIDYLKSADIEQLKKFVAYISGSSYIGPKMKIIFCGFESSTSNKKTYNKKQHFTSTCAATTSFYIEGMGDYAIKQYNDSKKLTEKNLIYLEGENMYLIRADETKSIEIKIHTKGKEDIINIERLDNLKNFETKIKKIFLNKINYIKKKKIIDGNVSKYQRGENGTITISNFPENACITINNKDVEIPKNLSAINIKIFHIHSYPQEATYLNIDKNIENRYKKIMGVLQKQILPIEWAQQEFTEE